MRRRTRYRDKSPPDLNITAFMNLMVILVPFLLITAVFSRITILQLNLPTSAETAPDQAKPELQLEVIIRADSLEVADRRSGLLKTIANKDDGYDLKALSEFLQAVKARFPDKLDATILPESETSYDTLIQVMDTVRMAQVLQAGSVVKAELFPEISIGDAPAAEGRSGAAQENNS